MLKLLRWIAFVACFGGANAAATPILYNIDFSGGLSAGLVPTSGSFIYDASAPLPQQFSNFFVVWDGLVFDLTSSANAPQIIGPACGASNAINSFQQLTGVGLCSNSPSQLWHAQEDAANDIAAFTFQGGFCNGPGGLCDSYIIIGAVASYAGGIDQEAFGSDYLATAIPEPFTLSLFGAGLVGAIAMRRQKKKSG